MDSDDILDTDALKYLINESRKNKLDVLYFDGEAFYEDDNLAREYPSYKRAYIRHKEYSKTVSGNKLFNEMLIDGCYYVLVCLQLIRKEHLLEEEIFFPEDFLYEDNVFCAKAMLMAKRVSHRKKRFFKRRVRKYSTVTGISPYGKFINYFRCCWAMVAFLNSKDFDDVTLSAIQKELDMMLRAIRANYRKPSFDDIKNYKEMTFMEKTLFESFLLPTIKR